MYLPLLPFNNENKAQSLTPCNSSNDGCLYFLHAGITYFYDHNFETLLLTLSASDRLPQRTIRYQSITPSVPGFIHQTSTGPFMVGGASDSRRHCLLARGPAGESPRNASAVQQPVHRRADGGARLTHGWRRVRWGGANRVWMSLHKASAHCLESLEMKVGKPAFRYFLSGRGRTHMQYL